MKNYKFSNKQPNELTEEELLELTSQIAMIEYTRRSDIKMMQDYEDTAMEVLTYAYEKSSRGKKGINEQMNELSMPHFINTLHFETRNNINYIVRKKKSQQYLYNTDSLDTTFDSEDGNRSMYESIPDTVESNNMENNVELWNILSKIDDTENSNIGIKIGYGDKAENIKFSYRNMAKLYFNLSSGNKIKSKDLKGILYNKKTGTDLEESEIKTIMNSFKNYMKKECILGGTI